MDSTKADLLARIAALEAENALLRAQTVSHKPYNDEYPRLDAHFSADEYRRYGRQMIVPEMGALDGQKRLQNAKVLVVGAGGLGCPALLYISAAGVGNIGIVDADTVDTSNLHRQVLHTTETVGMLKCESAKRYIGRLNPHVQVQTYAVRLSNDNAFDIIRNYDIVLDCTDTPATRYLINDVAVLCGKTVVSGSGLKADGQLSILNFNNVGPCYRCFYPKPPSPESVTTCSDGGVIGPAIGLVGVTMAMETIKLVTKYYENGTFQPFISMYSAYPQQKLRVFKMRSKVPACTVCGSNPAVSEKAIVLNEIDYAAFCGKLNPNVLDAQLRVSVRELHSILNSQTERPFLLDVRPKEQFAITKLSNSTNIQWDPDFSKLESIDSFLPSDFNKKEDQILVICRYGNDSQLAARKLIEELHFENVKDVKGGLNRWSEEIDPTIPIY